MIVLCLPALSLPSSVYTHPFPRATLTTLSSVHAHPFPRSRQSTPSPGFLTYSCSCSFALEQDGAQGNAFDSRIFWYSLYITPVVWVLFAIIALIQLSFTWLLIVAVAVMLSVANAIGYVRCQRDAARKRAAAAGTGEGFFSTGIAGSLGRIVSDTIIARARS